MIQWDWWKCFIGWFVTEPVMKTETTGQLLYESREEKSYMFHM